MTCQWHTAGKMAQGSAEWAMKHMCAGSGHPHRGWSLTRCSGASDKGTNSVFRSAAMKGGICISNSGFGIASDGILSLD